MNELIIAAIAAHLVDLATFLRVSPALVATQETNPLPHMFGPTAGAIAAKLIMSLILVVTVVAFRRRPRTRATLIATYAVLGIVGAASNVLAH